MNPGFLPSENESGTIKKKPVSKLLATAGDSFDAFGDEYTETHESGLLVGKKRIIEEIVDECEKYGSDWDLHKDRISTKIGGLVWEINDLIDTQRFSTSFDRVGYSPGSNNRNINALHRLSKACRQKNTDADNSAGNTPQSQSSQSV